MWKEWNNIFKLFKSANSFNLYKTQQIATKSLYMSSWQDCNTSFRAISQTEKKRLLRWQLCSCENAFVKIVRLEFGDDCQFGRLFLEEKFRFYCTCHRRRRFEVDPICIGQNLNYAQWVIRKYRLLKSPWYAYNSNINNEIFNKGVCRIFYKNKEKKSLLFSLFFSFYFSFTTKNTKHIVLGFAYYFIHINLVKSIFMQTCNSERDDIYKVR